LPDDLLAVPQGRHLDAHFFPRLHLAPELHLVDGCEEVDGWPLGVDDPEPRAADLGDGLEQDDARHHGVAGEVTGEEEVLLREPAVSHDALGIRLLDAVDEQERISVGNQRLRVSHGVTIASRRDHREDGGLAARPATARHRVLVNPDRFG